MTQRRKKRRRGPCPTSEASAPKAKCTVKRSLSLRRVNQTKKEIVKKKKKKRRKRRRNNKRLLNSMKRGLLLLTNVHL